MRYEILSLFELERRPAGTIVHLAPEVDVLNFQEILDHLVTVIKQEQPPFLLVNAEHITYLQSAALGRLATLASSLKNQGGRLQICGLTPDLQEVMSRARFEQLIDIHPTVHAACESWPPVAAPRPAPQAAPIPTPEETASRLSGLQLAAPEVRNAAVSAAVELGDRETIRARQFVKADSAPEAPHAWGTVSDLFPEQPPANRALRGRRVMIPPNAAEPFHRHEETEEFLYVLRGNVEQWIDRAKQSLTAGDVAYIPVNAAHATFNDTEETAELLQVCSSTIAGDRDRIELGDVEPWRSVIVGREYRGFDVDRTEGILVATVTSKSIVDPLGLQQFKSGLMSILQRESPKVLLLDLSQVDFLSSAVLGGLVVAWQELGKNGGRGGLCGLTPGIRKVFEISRLDRTIPLFGSRDEALAALSRRS